MTGRALALAAAVLLLSCAGATPALTPAPVPACMPRASLVALLAERFGESRRAWGLGAAGRLVEVFAHRSGRSWSIALTGPGGTSCVVAVGTAWERNTYDDRPEFDPLSAR